MKEIGRDGHRERIREDYLNNPDAEMSDIHVIELLLTYAIPRKDVKPIAYALINEFHTLENIISADINELKKIDGIGERSAILFHLINRINKTIVTQQAKKPKNFNNSDIVARYLINSIGQQNIENFIVITLNNKNDVINFHTISQGNAKNAQISKEIITRKVLNDHAAAVVLAHNHPNSSVSPSMDDIDTTVSILNLLRQFEIKLHDHIIVNEKEALCMSATLEYANYFD